MSEHQVAVDDEHRGQSPHPTNRRSLRSIHSVSHNDHGPSEELVLPREEEHPSFSAMRRASMVVAARFRSAQRSSSIQRQIAVEGDVRSKRTLSDGEAIAVEKMMENQRHRQDVVRRADLINAQCAAVLDNEELEKERQLKGRLQELNAQRDEQRRRRSLSARERHQQVAQRQKEQEAARIARIEANIRHTNTVRYDPFSQIAMRQKYSSPERPRDEETARNRRTRSQPVIQARWR